MFFTTEICIVIALILLKYCVCTFLEKLNAKNVSANSAKVPEVFSSMISEPDYFKSVKYTLSKISFGIVEDAFSSIVLILVLLFGVFPHLFYFCLSVFGVSVWAQSFAMIITLTILSLPMLPFEWYSQFVIEQKFGFNKSTVKLWISDKIKEFIIGLVLGLPLIALILWLFWLFENTWWIWGFCALAVFQLVMLVVYPRFIMPLFNKLSPLEEGELKNVLLAMSDRAGFKADSIYVIDGSKRSSHSNAFFTGFGKFRRIVLYDTLISQLTIPELEAVLAHEIGHYKLGHIPRMIASSFIMMFLGFGMIAYLAQSPWFYEGFGFELSDGMAPALILFSTFAGLITFWFTPLFNIVSRKFEYQADAFAKKVCGSAAPLIEALRKLHTKNLGNLTPHKIYSMFYYSHPTLLEREAALKSD